MYTDAGSTPEEEAEFGQTIRGVVGGTKLFNRFALQKVLGRGGMGIVWLARDERLDRLIALKVVPEAVCFDPSAHEDLKRETRKSLLLTHPNIVRIFDFIEEGQNAAISMEYVDGATLSSLRVKKPAKCFEIAEISPWIISLCEALGYAHESASIIHRDLKPSNLMVNSRGDLKVTDFGIAVTLRDSMSCISVRTSSGTLNYMSPQQMLGEDPSASDDIYAVGATLYELLSSKPPFYGGDVASQVREVTAPTIAQRRAKLGIAGESIPKHWEETIARCLAKDPDRRPRTPGDIARGLRLAGPVRLTNREQPAVDWKQLAEKYRAVLGGGIAALIAAIALISHRSPKAVATGITQPATPPGYALEKRPETAALPQPSVPLEPNHAARPVVPEEVTEPPRSLIAKLVQPPASTESKPTATLQLTTTPAHTAYTVYPGVIVGKPAPGSTPLHSGFAPDAVEDLPPGRYTLFFHCEGWPDDRAEIAVTSGENVPVNYTFPHGTALVTSTPDGAEIFFGKESLGQAPASVDLPLGKQKLIARFRDGTERSQTVMVSNGQNPVKVAFQLKSASHSSRTKATPTPSALDKIGQSFKKVFGGHKTAPRKK
jgi:serine/threonine protein kinase